MVIFCRNLAVLVIFLVSTYSLAQRYVPGEVIIKYKNSSDKLGVQSSHNRISSQKGMRSKNSWSKLNTFHYKIESQKTVPEIINELKNDPEIEYIEPNYYVSITRSIRESAKMTEEEALDYIASQNENGSMSLPHDQTGAPINLTESWSQLSPSNTPVVVAVIDTGIDFRNNLLKDARWVNSGEIPNDGIDNDGNGYIDDVYGWNFVGNNNNPTDCNDHGTHVAGIVRGSTQDLVGASAASIQNTKVQLMALKFLDCDGIGTTADAIKAIYYAVNKGAKILNNSWGGGAYSTALHQAIGYSYQFGTLFVAAAGNSATNIDSTPSYPASYNVPNVISVGATNNFDYSASFSNYGITNVHIAAPGVGVLSPVICNSTDVSCSLTGTMTGTSMAAPFIAGIAAMMKYERPIMLGHQMKSILTSSSDTPLFGGTPKLDGRVKNGLRVNASSSVVQAKSASIDNNPPAYDVSANLLRAPASEAAGGCGLVQKVYNDYNNNEPPSSGNPLAVILIIAISLVPLVIASVLVKNPRNQRRFERFHLDTNVQISIGSAAYLGQVGTISLGGLSFNSNAVLKLGNDLNLKVSSPDGKESIQVQGQVVWMSNTQNYGVKFLETKEQTISKIQEWTHKLKKA